MADNLDRHIVTVKSPDPVRKQVAYHIYHITVCCCGADLVMLGVGYHHAGVDLADRKLIEEAFTQGDLPVLCESQVHSNVNM